MGPYGGLLQGGFKGSGVYMRAKGLYGSCFRALYGLLWVLFGNYFSFGL